jgi:glycosyltransferase involved in cell wall biosynthesis
LRFLPTGIASQDTTWCPAVPPKVVSCARLHARKQPVLFVEAVALLLKRVREVEFIIAGPDGGEAPSVVRAVERCKASSSIQIVGPLQHTEVPAFLASANVYVLPSIDEPSPLTLLNALAIGVSSICHESCGVAQAIQETDAEVVLKELSAKSLSLAIERILRSDSLVRMSAAARGLAKSAFSIDMVRGLLERHYADAVTRPRTGRRRSR